jgi:hypothetical protein
MSTSTAAVSAAIGALNALDGAMEGVADKMNPACYLSIPALYDERSGAQAHGRNALLLLHLAQTF